MKIVEQNSNKLVIKETRPLFQWIILLIACSLMFAGLLTSFLSPICVKIKCDKSTSQCTLSSYYVLRNPEFQIINLNEIQKAFYKNTSSKDKTICYVYFLSKGKEIPVENCSDSNDGESKAAQINNFMKDSKQSELAKTQDNTLIGFIFISAMIIIAGVLLISFTKAMLILSVFDKTNGLLTIIEKNLFNKKINTYKLIEICKVSIVNINKDKKKGNVSSGATRLELITKPGDNISLSINYSEDDKDKKQIAKAIRYFLNLR